MANFYASKEWVILFPSNVPEVKKAAGDLSRYIGLLAGQAEGLVQKPPALLDAHDSVPADAAPTIVLNCEESGPQRNGFSWRAGPERVEIYGESGRGLCNGIYSFLGALGIGWPAPGQEILPSPQVTNLRVFPISPADTGTQSSDSSVFEPSNYEGNAHVTAPWRRFVPAGKKEERFILKRGEAFVTWAARRRYDALIFPLAAFAAKGSARKLDEIKKLASEYGITIEAGGRELSSFVPRRFYLLHRDFFRMEGGKRNNDHHFCPTNPGTIRVIGKEGEKLFRAAADIKVFHLWPDKDTNGLNGTNSAWCSCPTCRAFTPAEQYRIGVNAAADILAAVNPDAMITFYEKNNNGGNIPLRHNLFKMEKLPEEREFH